MIKAPRGTKDILEDEIYFYQYAEEIFCKICKQYNFTEIRTPIFEDINLFTRTIGETSDIVKKEMYDFFDKKGRHLALRPEGTAPIIRAYIEKGLYTTGILQKFYYISPMFRYDRPQKGRYRQFHQLGVEAIGSSSPVIDVEVIKLGCDFLDELKIKYKLHLNSVGCSACRPNYSKEIKTFLKDKVNILCDDCKIRYEKNTLRIFDCKVEKCKEVIFHVPSIFSFLCNNCSSHLNLVKNYLELLNISYLISENLVRGLDYYTKTIFEVMPEDYYGTQNALLGGGRYDNLVEELGGPSVSCVGWAAGEERIVEQISQNYVPKKECLTLFIITLGDDAEKLGLKLLSDARKNGIKAEINCEKKSLKAQLKYADKINAKYSLIIGENEIKKNLFILRDMKKSEQKEIKPEDIFAELSQ